jgi:hypothetical protein
VGAEVRVTTESGRSLYNHMTASVGFMSSSDRRLHFGLAVEKGIREVEIRWPSGTVQKLAGLAVNRYHNIEVPE